MRALDGRASPRQRMISAVAVASVFVFGGAAAHAESDRPAIEQKLQQSGAGLSADAAHALTRGETQILFAIVDDRAVAPVVRGRAVTSLGWVRSAAAHDFLENLIIRKLPSSDAGDRLLLRKAAVALGWQSGPRVVDTLAPLLEHVDPDVRLDAAVGLGLSRNHAAEQPLRDRLTREDDANVRRQLETQLRQLASASTAGHPPEHR
ncbi:MAG TPA: HEAT repeat domain-containing protein [Polyangia bacterium]